MNKNKNDLYSTKISDQLPCVSLFPVQSKLYSSTCISLKEWDFLDIEKKNKDFLSERDNKEKYLKTPMRYLDKIRKQMFL